MPYAVGLSAVYLELYISSTTVWPQF